MAAMSASVTQPARTRAGSFSPSHHTHPIPGVVERDAGAVRPSLAGAAAEYEVGLFGLDEGEGDAGGEQVPERQNFLAGVLQGGDDHDAHGPALGRAAARGRR